MIGELAMRVAWRRIKDDTTGKGKSKSKGLQVDAYVSIVMGVGAGLMYSEQRR